jgi:uncharacterized cupredoxin-like copper-binding protein
MRRRLIRLVAVAAAASAVLLTASVARSSSEHRAAAATSSRLQVIELEYRLTLSRGTVKAGPVSLEAIDRGMDPHDLRLRKVATQREIAVPELTSRQRWDGVVRLTPGIYDLWCSLPEHAKLGMHARLKVVR